MDKGGLGWKDKEKGGIWTREEGGETKREAKERRKGRRVLGGMRKEEERIKGRRTEMEEEDIKKEKEGTRRREGKGEADERVVRGVEKGEGK